MFYPQEMTEIELIVPEQDILPVIKVLAGEGVFHQLISVRRRSWAVLIIGAGSQLLMLL